MITIIFDYRREIVESTREDCYGNFRKFDNDPTRSRILFTFDYKVLINRNVTHFPNNIYF